MSPERAILIFVAQGGMRAKPDMKPWGHKEQKLFEPQRGGTLSDSSLVRCFWKQQNNYDVPTKTSTTYRLKQVRRTDYNEYDVLTTKKGWNTPALHTNNIITLSLYFIKPQNTLAMNTLKREL